MKKIFALMMALLMAACLVACTVEKDGVQQDVDAGAVSDETVIVDNAGDSGVAEGDEEFMGGYGGPGDDYVESEQEYQVPEGNEEAY